MEENRSKIWKYLSADVIATFSFFSLLFGGLILFIYYSSIQYLPDFDLASSITILGFSSFTGFIILSSILILLVYPGLLWKKI